MINVQEQALVPYQTASLPPGPWLVFAPHPDDETFGMGGTLLLAKEAGIEVSIVVMTDGAMGGEGDPEHLAQTREQEAQKVASRLHLKQLIFWREPDRGLEINTRLIAKAQAVIKRVQPATIFFPSPMEFHPDHRMAGALVWQAAQQMGYVGKCYAYEISVQGRVNRLHDITSVIEEKKALIDCYKSQLQANDYQNKIIAINRARTYSLPPEMHYAEGFYEFSEIEGDYAKVVLDSLSLYWQSVAMSPAENDGAREINPDIQSLLEQGASKMDANPLVSVIVRTKDRPELLSEALQSLVGQTYSNLEVIVVNDGGVDVSSLLSSFEDRLTIRYLHFEQNRGRCAAGNAGLEAAKGDYLAFLDDDDWFLPEHFENLVKIIHARPEKAVYVSVQAVREQNGQRLKEHLFELDYDPLRLQCVNYIPIHAVLFDRSLLDAGCCLDETLDHYEDWDFWLQVAEKTDFFHFKRVTAVYRLPPDGGFGVNPDSEEQRIAWHQLLEKWRSRWSVEKVRELTEHALRGLDLEKEKQLDLNHIKNLENQIDAYKKEKYLDQNHIKNLENQIEADNKKIELAQSHIENLESLIDDYKKEVVSLTHALEQKAGLLKLCQKELEATKVHSRNQEEMITHLRQVIKEKEAQIGQVTQQVQQLQTETEVKVRELQVKEAELARWRHAYEEVMNSTSWRVSAPVRMFGRAWKRFRRLYRSRNHEFEMEAGDDLRMLEDGKFVSTGQDPHILLRSNRGKAPSGWVRIKGQLSGTALIYPVLYIDDGSGFNEDNKIFLNHCYDAQNGRIEGIVRLPDKINQLRFDPASSYGEITCRALQIQEIGLLQAAWRILGPQLKSVLKQPGSVGAIMSKVWRIYRHQGWLGLKLAIVNKTRSESDYQQWWQHYGVLFDSDRKAIRNRIQEMSLLPKFSILMPVYNPDEIWLRKALDSVCNQLYPYWELCIADDASTLPHVRNILEEYAQKDDRIKVKFRDENGHISAASNSALALATGQFLALMDQDDELTEHALYMVAEELNRYPDAELIYSDEDKIDEQGQHHEPYFKPDWNPLLLLGQNYPSHLSVLKTERVRSLGGFREGLEGSQDWDLIFRFTENLPSERIRHIPFVLYHWRMIPGSTALDVSEKSYVREVAVQVVKEHLDRIGFEHAEVSRWVGGYCRVRFPLPEQKPLVSLIIPTRNGYHLLHRCVETLLEKTAYPNYELIVVDNQSDDPETVQYLEQLADRDRVTVIPYDAPFNFSALNNQAVTHARGEILGFLNNDLEILHADWLDEMVSHAVRPETGAVGAMLYYPDDRIQHAGVILGVGGIANHAYQGMPRGVPGQLGRALLLQNLSAVTAACLIVRRSIFEEVGGYDEEALTVAFNDVDLCLKIQQRGYWNVWTPFAELYHHESATRGREDTPEKLARFNREISIMLARWGHVLFEDPAYNPNLTLNTTDFSLAFPPRVVRPWSLVDSDPENHHVGSAQVAATG